MGRLTDRAFCASVRAAMIGTAFCISVVQMPAVRASGIEEIAQRVGIRVLAEATSENEVLSYTKSRIPWNKMSPGAQRRASAILNDLSQYRRMPSLQYPVDPNMYQYLINHPDVAVSTWRVMGISQLKMWQADKFEYEASSSDGSSGAAHVLWRDANQCLFIVEGSYNSPLLPRPIEASALVWLQYRFVKDPNGQPLVNQQVETFVHFPSSAIDTIARMASRVTNTILDRNAFEVSLYARMMSQASQKDPAWIAEVARRMEDVPAERRTELAMLAQGVSPEEARALPPANAQIPATTVSQQRQLPQSGEFRNFESSMHLLNVHVPLVADEVQHKPSYGQRIGASAGPMTTPHRYITQEGQKAIEEQEARRERMRRYNAMYAPGRTVAVQTVPPVAEAKTLHPAKTPQVAELMDAPAPLVFFSAGSQKADGNAKPPTAGVKPATPVAPSTPARPVSNSKPVAEPSDAPPPVPPAQ